MAGTANGGKRAMDLVVGGTLLIVSLPIQAVLAALVRLSSPGAALHRAVRVGRGGRPFTLYKFRTMVADAGLVGPAVTAADDARVTTVGRFLRRTRFDELPQLFNVVRGDMSLVGPRPEDPRFVGLYDQDQRAVLRVRPGITGPTQLRFLHEERLLTGKDPERAYLELMPQKLASDLEYVRDHSLRGDLRILVRTVRAVLS